MSEGSGCGVRKCYVASESIVVSEEVWCKRKC